MMGKEVTLEEKKKFAVHPKTMIVWLFIITIVMAFAAWTSAMIVDKGTGNWMEFDVPSVFKLSTALILLSSGTLHLGYVLVKRDKLSVAGFALAGTMVLGIAFMVSQVYGWGNLIEQNVYVGGKYSNNAGSFMYVITAVHWVHIIAGLIYIIAVMALLKRKAKGEERERLYRNGATFWHFLGILWLYLYIFLIINY